MFWGFTPALDLQCELKKNSTLKEEINILIIGGADCRHVFQTLAKRYRHKNTKINFYLIEACPETIAKQLLLLYVALQPEEELGLFQKTRYFMELYGNTMIRPAVARYLTARASDFVDMITNFDSMKKVMPFLTVDVKYKERDYLENLFKFWCGSDNFDICDSWDRRVRKSLGIRYDNKKGAFDWDLHMRYHHVGGNLVSNQEYQSFRSNGVAFSWMESEVSKPNRSMVCGTLPNGKTFLHYGYLGDIVTGPYVAYGLDCVDKEFLKKTNNSYSQRSTDVTERNLREIFHEIHHKSEYNHQKTNNLNLGCIVTQLNEMKVTDPSADIANNTLLVKKPIKTCIDLDGVQIMFLSLSALSKMGYKKEYSAMFDMIYFNFAYLKQFDKDIIKKIAKSGSLLYIENQRFVLNFRDKDLENYKNEVKMKVEHLECKEIQFNAAADNYFQFLIN